MDQQDAQPAGRHRKPVAADLDLPATEAVIGGVAARAPGSASSRDVDLARFLAAAREQAAPAAPRSRPARGGHRRPFGGPPRGRRGSAVQVCLLALLALLVLWVVHTSGRGPAAPGVSPAVATVAVTSPPHEPPATRPPATRPPATRPPPTRLAPTTTRRVAVVPVVAPQSWPDIVGELFRARSTAFAQGIPALLLAADAADSPVLAADRRLFATTVRSAGYQRVAGLGFDLSAVRTVSETAAVARLEVTGRQRASRLVGPTGTRAVPAGPVRTVLIELRRPPGGAGWRIQDSTAVR